MAATWSRVAVGDLLARPLRNGISPSKKGAVTAEVLTLSAVTGSRFDPNARKTAHFESEHAQEKTVRRADLLICRGNGNIGLVGRARRPRADMPDVAFPDTMIGASFDLDRVDLTFLEYLWGSHVVRGQVEELARSTNGTHKINQGMVEGIEIPLPPIDEQRRIAAVLDAADELRAKRREALAKLDTLTQAIFIDMFGDPLDRSTPTQPLSKLATLVMGQSPPGDSYNSAGLGTPLLNGPTEFGPKYPQAVQWTTAPMQLSEPGDILFCVRGATAGRLNWSDGEYCLGRGLAAVRAPETRRDYLFRVLDAYYPHFQSAGVGSTFINISKKELQTLPVPQTDEATASIFAARVSALDVQKALMESAAQSCSDLFSSLQQRAFRGQL